MKYNKRFFALALSFLMFSSGMSFAEGKDCPDIFQEGTLIPEMSEKNVPLAKHVKKSNSKKDNSNKKNSNKKNKKEKAGKNPSIVVSTPFPTGKVENNAIDVKYTAKPSKNAKITQVSYIINDDFEEFIYIAGKKGVQQKGKLGTARVLLLPGENKVVFKVTDSSGKSATFDVKERLDFDSGFQTPNIQPDEISDLSDGTGRKFINNRIVIYAKENISSEQIENVVKSMNAKIIGKATAIGRYTIKVSKSTEDELLKMCESLTKDYPNIVEEARLSLIDGATIQ